MTTATAEHRPATQQRRFRHDSILGGDFFAGFGGLTRGMHDGGVDTIVAANHNRYKVEIHEANHPEAEHWIADLVDEESAAYHDVRHLPAVDFLGAGVSCTNHSPANTQKAYASGDSLFTMEDPDYDERVTRSEKDRATANCVLHYAAVHHPRLILVECTTELQSWGALLPGKRKVGDGSTYRWWLKQFGLLGYRHRVVFLNSMFFGVPQSRNRGYWCFWDAQLPTPDLDHRPHSWCGRCDTVVEAVWTWRTGPTATGRIEWGKQYEYRCPSCRAVVVPPSAPSLNALDLTDLGTRIGDKPIKTQRDGTVGPLAAATLARAERCRQKFAGFPAVLMPAKAAHGTEKHPWQPMATQTSQQETAIVSTGAVMVAAGNGYEHPGSSCRSRGLDEPLWTQPATNTVGLMTPPTAVAVDNFQGVARGAGDALPTQGGSETLALVSSGVVPFRRHTTPTSHAEAMPTVTSDQIPGLLTAAGTIKNNGAIDEASYRSHPVSDPLGAVTAASAQGLLFSGWYKQNGSEGTETAPHPMSDPFGTLTSRDTTALLMAEWRAALADLSLEDCYFRMLNEREVGRGCGFDVDFPGHQGSFVVWGSARHQVDGFGNAVSPPVGQWLTTRMCAALHSERVA